MIETRAYPYLQKLSESFRLVLGSGSPRRKSLLSDTGISFRILKPTIDESMLLNEDPYEYALRLAREKAVELQVGLNDNEIIMSCDTIVVLQDDVLGKPTDEQHALTILSSLSGQRHVVCTSVALANRTSVLKADYDTTTVFFNNVTENQLREYIDSGEPMDKAGAYGIQGMGAFLVDRIEGNMDTVIGLPRALCDRLAGDILQQLNAG